MADLFRANYCALELHQGSTRTIRVAAFLKAGGADAVLGRTSSSLSKGAPVDLTGYDALVAAIGTEDGTVSIGLQADWETQDPAVALIVVTSVQVQTLLCLRPNLKQFVWTVKCVRSRTDEFVIVHGPVTIHRTALRVESIPLDVETGPGTTSFIIGPPGDDGEPGPAGADGPAGPAGAPGPPVTDASSLVTGVIDGGAP